VPVFPYFVIVANYDHIKKGHTIYPTRVKLIQINHGLGLAKAFYYTASLLRRPMAMYLVSGKLAKQKLIEAGVSGIIEDVGFAKLDKLFDGSIEQATIFNRLNFEPGKPVILYAPTFGELSTMDEVLPYLPAVAANYNLLIKLHQLTYREASIIKSFRSLPNVFFIEDPDCTPYLFVSDLLISDISSIVFEYALLDRPIILILPPEEIWRPAVTDPYWWQVGYHLDNPKQLIPTIKQLLTNGDPEQTAFRRQLFEKTGIPRDGKSAERSASAILSFLGEI
jgi:CDP-glycerol glycerophosphotransferase (TagB/SpsB family)